MPRMNECFMGFCVHISPPGHINTFPFRPRESQRLKDLSSTLCCLLCVARHRNSLLCSPFCSVFPSAFGSHFLTHGSCYQKHQIFPECFGRSAAPKLPPTSLTRLDQNPLLIWVLCTLPSFLVCPTLGTFITSDPFWCCLPQLSACCYAPSYKQTFFFDICTVCGDVFFFLQNISVPQVLQALLTKCFLFCFVHLSVDIWKTSGSNLMSLEKSRSS